MKPIVASVIIFAGCVAAFAQANTFPASGNVGIGTTSPLRALHIGIPVYAANAGGGMRMGDPGNNYYVEQLIVTDGNANPYYRLYFNAQQVFEYGYGLAGNYLGLSTNGTEKFRITSAGNVGIGTTSPYSKLHVYNTGTMRPSNSTTNPTQAGIVVQGAANTALCFGASESPTDQYAGWIQMRHTLEANDTFPLSLQPNGGNVGIGTTSPNGRLCVADSNAVVRLGAYWGDISGTIYVDIYNDGTKTLFDNYKSNVGYLPLILNGSGGNVGIGTTNPTEKLSVNGRIRAKEVVVETTNWSDYVLAKDHKLTPLAEVEKHIEKEGHLPGVPSAQEVADKGVSVGEMQAILLAKIEELTLHVIQQEKDQQAQQKELVAQQAQIEAQATKITALESENTQLKSLLK